MELFDWLTNTEEQTRTTLHEHTCTVESLFLIPTPPVVPIRAILILKYSQVCLKFNVLMGWVIIFQDSTVTIHTDNALLQTCIKIF